MKRRTFLETGATLGGALIVGFHLGEASAQEQQERKLSNPFDAWIRVASDGSVTLVVAKSEMGQGVMTSLPMILADELDVDFSKVKVEQARTDPAVYELGTGGSSSVRKSYLPLRQAAASAREMLVRAAAERWNVNPNTCKTEKGTVVHGPRTKRLAYGELAAAAARLPVPDPKNVTLKNPAEFHVLGTPAPRVDIPSKVDGSARFGIDVRLPGLLFAVVARCPTFGGVPKSFDAAKTKSVAGVRHVLEIPPVKDAYTTGGVAAVADTTWAAIKGREALAVDWDHGPHHEESSASLRQQFEEVVGKEGKVVRDEGDAAAALAKAARPIEAAYELPFQAHAPMEPINATVHVKADGAEAWLPCQGPQWPKDAIAKVIGVAPDKVEVHTTLMGGGFGRRYHTDFAVEAAQISKAVGAPVQVLWTREDDLQHCFYRSAALHRFQGALDGSGRIAAWHDRMTSISIDGFWSPPEKAKPESTEIDGAANLPYAIPSVRMEYAPARSGVPVMWWRSVEHSINGFATECFFDELAAAAGKDPLGLRLDLLAESRQLRIPPDNESTLEPHRLKGVLEAVAQAAGWGTPLPKGRGRGIAAHFSFDTYVAEVAEVTVANGKLRVERVVCAVDCGRVINPDGVRAQIEGAVIYGLTAALKSAITIEHGGCQQSNFHDYPMLRIDETPVIDVVIVPSDQPPTGVGEPGVPPVAAAVGNAIFAATGRRLRRLPFRAEDLA
jgi:isoquinoline 1-oxidoreductase beta subunit